MFEDFAAMGIFSIPCALFGAMVGFSLNKWAKGWSRTKRFLWTITASAFPAIAVACLAIASTKDAQMSDYYYLIKNEFLRPFSIQLVMVFILAIPMAWLITRRETGSNSVAGAFE